MTRYDVVARAVEAMCDERYREQEDGSGKVKNDVVAARPLAVDVEKNVEQHPEGDQDIDRQDGAFSQSGSVEPQLRIEPEINACT